MGDDDGDEDVAGDAHQQDDAHDGHGRDVGRRRTGQVALHAGQRRADAGQQVDPIAGVDHGDGAQPDDDGRVTDVYSTSRRRRQGTWSDVEAGSAAAAGREPKAQSAPVDSFRIFSPGQ